MPILESPTAADAPEVLVEYQPRPTKAGRRERQNARRARVLSVSPLADDHRTLRRILGDTVWQLLTAATCADAISQLGRNRISVIFCEQSLADGTWRDVLDFIGGAGEPPPLIVTSRVADESLWAEVLNLGGYDLLAKPFRDREVQLAIASAAVHAVSPYPRARAAGGA